jgi:hypothetical protein
LKKILAGFFLVGCWWNAEAQSSKCEETLNQATEEFSAGHFYEIATLLKPCLDRNDFTNEQRVRANLLLTQAYLILDNPVDAEASYLKLLKADPEYVATAEKDPIDVVYLSKKFTSTPIFTPHLRIGLNTSFYRNIHTLSANGDPNQQIHRTLRVGFQVGAGVDWNITNNWSLCAEGILSNRSYGLNISGISAIDNLLVTEKHFDFDIPVYLKYSIDKGRIRPYGYAGFAGNLLLTAKTKLVYNNNTANKTGSSTQSAEGPDVNFLYQRKQFAHSFVVGGGIKYKIGKDYLFADVRYMAGMSNLTLQNNYDPPAGNTSGGLIPSYISTYRYVPSLYRLDNLSLSFGYIRPLYNPRKIRKLSFGKIFNRKSKKTK